MPLMNTIKIATLFLALYCITLIAPAQPKTTPDEKTRTFLSHFQTEYIQAILSKKPDNIAAYLAPDIRLMPEYQKTVMNKVNALAYHKAYSTRFHITTYTRETIEILDLGKRVVEFGLFTQHLLHKTNKKNYTLNGKYCNIWERTDNGTLLLIT